MDKSYIGMRATATGLLVLMALVFCAVRFLKVSSPASWLEWVEAFAEAAMVGALADWFAVTALFRHPLGIPIPHTAIISSRKDQIGEALGEFVQTNFLSAKVIGEKLQRMDIATRLTHWLQDPQKTFRFCNRLTAILPEILGVIDDSDIRKLVRSNLSSVLKEIRLSGVLSTVLKALMDGDKHQELLNEGLVLFESLMDRHAVFLREALREEMPWYVPNFVHDKVYHDVILRVHSTLHSINLDPNHPSRTAFTKYIWKLIEELRDSPQFEMRCKEAVKWIFESPLLSDYADNVWASLKESILNKIAKDQDATTAILQKALAALGKSIEADKVIVAKLNNFVVNAAQRLANEYKAEVAELITDTVKRWDSKTAVAKIEQQVGRDLQYIRINGTIVGGLVGLAIHAISIYLV